MTAIPSGPAGARRGGPRLVLAGVLGLLLVGEMALGPFYPQLLREVHGTDNPGDTGLVLWASRLSAMVALPLLGLLARRIGAARVVTGGLAVAACADVAMALAPTLEAFVVACAVAAASGAALLLAYPALVALDGEGTPGVVWFAGLFHGAIIVAAATGALIVALPDPRIGLAAFAPVTLALLAVARRAMARATGPVPAGAGATGPAAPVPAPSGTGAPAGDAPSPPREAARRGPETERGGRERVARWALVLAPLVGIALLATVLDFAMAVVRPFFVTALEDDGRSAALATALFLLPSAAALATLPLARAARGRLGGALLPLALLLAAGGLALQAATASSVLPLALGRVAFGAGVVLAQVEIDRRVFSAVGVTGPGFAATETARGLGLVLAPLVAAAAAERDLLLPLAVGAATFAVAAAGALLATVPRASRRSRRVPSH
ncbi:hypothetical protein SK069_03910 [Patulibacter brassicae]|uniref:MFS transporter n=1 Tax=Patulibacter brassicae TaxID=1705717 RepID=A0ABU4VG02_9ACTN|nr:hypothetical protein [Patulibacter brassicae]MDX8150729.1 hypothetical protein [Patulibacter brassicae]